MGPNGESLVTARRMLKRNILQCLVFGNVILSLQIDPPLRAHRAHRPLTPWV